ncbi:MAG: MEKHLA domain-containing protein [Gloeomargarita sp. DG_2_bins_126]
MLEPWQEQWVQQHSVLLVQSFHHWTGQELIPEMSPSASLAKELFYTPKVILSHDTQADPRFNYGNQMALDLWETTWDQFIGLPSRLSAELELQPERRLFLQQVQQRGWAQNYQGIRITRQGRRFYLRNAILWNVQDSMGVLHGQAAMFCQWEWLKDTSIHPE